MRRAILWSALLLPLVSTAPAAIAGQGGQDEAGSRPADEAEKEKPKEIKRLSEWPKPADKDQLRLDITRLRKARTEEMESQAHAGLLAEGAAVVPFMLPQLGKERDEDSQERMLAVLVAVTGAEHTRLLAGEFANRAEAVRVFALQRVAAFPDTGVVKEAQEALARVKKAGKKGSKQELYVAALCCTSAGVLDGIEQLVPKAKKNWGKYAEEVRTALEAVRGKEATGRLAPLLEEKDRKTKLAGLRLLAGAGDRETSPAIVKPFLDDTDNSLRVGAINALRGIVDGDPPVEKLPVFEAIERANKWKARI